MNRPRDKTTEMESLISSILKAGVLLSATLLLIGIILFFSNEASNFSSYHDLSSSQFNFPHSLTALTSSLSRGQGIGFIGCGILLLILTPIIRVATSIVLFIKQKDTPMSLITSLVLVILIISFFVGLIS